MIPEIDFLKNIYAFQDLDQQEIEFIAQIMSPRTYNAGDVIMKEGEPGQSMYVIAEGEVEVNKTLTMKFGEDDYRETEKTLTVLKVSDYAVFGEMALVTDLERSATVTALSDCTLYEIMKEDFLGLAQANPSLGFKVTMRLAEMVSRRLKKVRRRRNPPDHGPVHRPERHWHLKIHEPTEHICTKVWRRHLSPFHIFT